jgi:FKBP-type peptidyl-prolyl cis-trans isomerase (trigger factor)
MANIKINKINDSEVEIIGEVEAVEFMKHWTPVVKKLNEQVTLDGFRKGNAPEKILLEKIGEEKVLIEMADTVFAKLYPEILTEHKIDAIGQPQVSITKLAKDNPLGFTIKTAIVPVLKLPDYKKIAKEAVAKAEKPSEVTDKEIEDVIFELQKQRAMSLEENKDLKPEDKDKLILPEITDDFVKTLGKFENVADFKAKIKENLGSEKEFRAKEKNRLAIMDAIAEKIEVTIPDILVQSELDKMVQELKYETSRMGLKFEDYLIHLKKTEDELKHNWKADAEKRVKLGLVVNAIIDDAKLEATKEELEHEVSHMLSHMGDQQPSDKDLPRVHSYAENTILHKKVFELLENNK